MKGKAGIWRKRALAGLCLAGSFLLLTACGKENFDSRSAGGSAAETETDDRQEPVTEESGAAPETPDGVPEGREVVWIWTIMQDPDLSSAVAAFNASNDTYWAEILYYGQNGGTYFSTGSPEGQEAINQIQLAMTTGIDCPDLMLVDSAYMAVQALAEQGYWEDLTPYLEKSDQLSAEDFVDGIPEAFTYGDCLITLPRYFSLQLLVGRKSQLEQFDSWTAEDLFAYGEQYPDSVLVKCYDIPAYTLLEYGELLRLYEMPPFVTEEAGRSIVDREKLTAFLEKIEKDSEQSVETLDDYPEKFSENHILLTQGVIASYVEVQLYRTLFEGDEAYIGYPSEDGRNIKIVGENSSTYGIPYYAQNKEGAWAFLEVYLSQPMNSEGVFPSRKDAFEAALQRDMLHEGFEVNEEGVLVLEGTNNPKSEKNIGGWAFHPGEISEEDVAVIEELISRAGHPFAKEYTDLVWLTIMSEEVPAYFNGQKSLEEVVDIIAARLQLYLDEGA